MEQNENATSFNEVDIEAAFLMGLRCGYMVALDHVIEWERCQKWYDQEGVDLKKSYEKSSAKLYFRLQEIHPSLTEKELQRLMNKFVGKYVLNP